MSMWKREEAATPPPAAPAARKPEPPAPRAETASRTPMKDTANIGKSVVIKGELTGSEDLTIEGQVDGKIELRQNVLTIGPNGKVKAQIVAKVVVVEGDVHGDINATERVDIRDKGSVDGDLSSPRVAIADGAHFRGTIDMQRGNKPAEAKPQDAKGSAAMPAPAAPVATSTH